MITNNITDQVATVTIDDPERRNPLSLESMADLADSVRRAGHDDDVRVIVITGAGEDAFSAGGDLSGGFVDSPSAGSSVKRSVG